MSSAEAKASGAGCVRDDSSSVYSRAEHDCCSPSPSVRKLFDQQLYGNRDPAEKGEAGAMHRPLNPGCSCCEVSDSRRDRFCDQEGNGGSNACRKESQCFSNQTAPDGNQGTIDDCCKDKVNHNHDKEEGEDQPCCSKDGTCKKPVGQQSSDAINPITEDNYGLDSCCPSTSLRFTRKAGSHPIPIADESRCCTADGECECSDQCLIEYASHLCSMDDDHCGEPVVPGEEACTGEKLRDSRSIQPGSHGAESAMSGLSLPRSSVLPSGHSDCVLRYRSAGTPCAKHLSMASEYASHGTPSPAEENVSSTVASSLKSTEAACVSNISNIIRRCFCRGPRRFVFPGERSCCTLRRERTQSLDEQCCKSARPSSDVIRIFDAPFERLPETDVEKGNDDHLYSLSLGVVGMTCTGCESKLRKVLVSYSGVSEVRTSFILNRADLVYDSSRISDPGEIISKVKRATGFTCTILRSGLAATDIVGERVRIRNLNPKGQDIFQRIDGVNQVVSLRNGVCEIFYNTQTVGIRDILDAANSIGGERPVELAPDSSSEEIAQATENTHWYWLMGRTIIAAILTIPVLAFAWAPVARQAPFPKQTALISSSLVLATVVQLLAIPIYKHAFRSLIYRKEIDMDVLVVLSITSAYIYSVVAFVFEIRLSTEHTILGHPIFETSSLLITLILLGRLMAAWIRRKAQNAIKLGTSQSKSARVVRKASPTDGFHPDLSFNLDEGESEILDSSLLHYGDIIQGTSSEHIVTDGIVVDGSAEMDEAHITGENDPVVRSKKSYVHAGSTIINGKINYRVTRLVSENTLSIVKRLVSTAASSRTKTLERADLAASYLTPIILAVACIAFLIWALVNRFVRARNDTDSSINALTHAIAILAISCPCALALAVPMVLTVASTVGAKKGVLFKTGAALEVGRKIDHVVFDKTGTLTSGQLSVLREMFLDEKSSKSHQEEIRKMAVMVTKGNRHPVSLAITQYLANHHFETDPTDDLSAAHSKITIGKGVEVATEKGTIRGGSPAWLGVDDHPKVKELLDASLTTFCVAQNNTLLAVYGLTSTIRPEADAVLTKLRSKKITTHLLSGDNPLAVTAVATQLNFNMANVRSLCQPESKAAYIRSLQTDPSTTPTTTRSCFRFRSRFPFPFQPSPSTTGTTTTTTTTKPRVLFIGDGTNDAPALTQADLGICMTNATDIAAAAADVGILSNSLFGLVSFLELSARATRRIRINIGWAVVYNLFAVLMAGGAFEAAGGGFRIEPSWAGVGEVVSLVPVLVVGGSLGWGWGWGRSR
ncbi:hypothetical protein AJ79_00512 [Helicocarpus griseus UAMH5409]|uniref:HMA domain-containing protein n=1 Tax=Helicocarpus griseus UAMH5409 TaxID=1447875 RepID=A0A2B7YC50_9EURO|nr:hypothetical protein AJ79_00512 [Helicocarpus griseus UAMH5409]